MTAGGRNTALLLIIAAVIQLGIDLPIARAGTYELRACIYEQPLHFDGRFQLYQHWRVDVVQTCDSQPRGRVGIYQTRKGTPFASGEGAGYWWQAPPGARFISSRVFAKLKNANGIAAQIFAIDPEGSYYSLDANTPHDGQEREMYVDFHTRPRSQVVIRIACLTNPPCSNRANDAKAFFEARHITLRLQDEGAPTMSASGDLFDRPTTESIYRGKVDFRYTASDDGGGVWQPYAEINGSIVELPGYGCAGDRGAFTDRTQPCPSRTSRQAGVDTASAPFREGVNRLRICARDYSNGGGSNVGCSPVRTLTVDNEAPAAPMSLTVAGGEAWRPHNGFDLSWHVPEGQTTEIVATHYRLEDPETGIVIQPEKQVPGGTSIKGLQVPKAGRYRVRVRLRDAAGNLGGSSTALLRFDDRRPSGGAPRPGPAWLSASDFPYRHELEPAEAGGPSGILGYALAWDRVGGSMPCQDGDCRADEIVPVFEGGRGFVDIERLDEGQHWLATAAVSGAMLRSADVNGVTFRVDLTDPRTRLEGVPTGWSRKPVELKAYAHDELSGMRPDPTRGVGPPVTTIELEDGRTWQRIGADADARITEEGIHRVRYWARDLAGNANDGRRLTNGHRHDPPGEATVKIDWTAPQVTFMARDPRSPELITASARDRHSGVAGGRIGFRPAGSALPFKPLATRFSAGLLSADFPSDTLPDGTYELEAIAEDRAGNRGYGTRLSGGTAMTLTVPVKPLSRISVETSRRGEGRRWIGPRNAVTVTGQLSDERGRGLPAAAVEIVEAFDLGARQRQRLTVLRTDERGRFTGRLLPGPSRKVSARFRGNRLFARSESSQIRLLSRARVNLRLSPQIARNGEAVKMTGRIWGRGAMLPDGGKLITLQYLDPGRGRWRPVELLRTNRRGRFRFRYRFKTVSSPQRFIFRAAAPAEAGWPYRAAKSGGQAVVVYPR